MTLTQILQKIRSAFYTKAETDTLLSGKSNDSDVVHKSGDETINGVKTFTSNINYPNGFLTSVMDNDFRISQYSGYGNGDNYKIIIQNTDGKVYAPNGFKGNLQGNADTATKATSAENGVDSNGPDWVRFKNGVQLCWGNIDVSSTSLGGYDPTTETYYNRYYVYNYAVPFSEEPSLNLSVVTGEASPFLMVTCESTGSDADRKTGTGSLMLFSKNKNGASLAIPTYICVLAIGRWK